MTNQIKVEASQFTTPPIWSNFAMVMEGEGNVIIEFRAVLPPPIPPEGAHGNGISLAFDPNKMPPHARIVMPRKEAKMLMESLNRLIN